MGAYFVGAALAAGAFSIRFVPAAYDIQTMHIMSQGVFTNTSQSGPYRGAGRPEAAYFMERLIEHAANVTGIDRAEIRRRNLIPENKLPYTTPTHWVYDSGEFVRLMDLCMESSDWKGYAARASANRRRTASCAAARSCFYIEFGGIFNDRMDMKFDPSGSLTIYGGTHSHGQGHATVFAQLAHEMLGVPFESIRYVQGDTAQVAMGRGTYGARSMVVGGNALKFAADQMIEKGKKIAAAMMEADAGDIEFKEGSFRVTGTDKAISLVDVAKATYAPMGPIAGKFGIGLDSTGSFDPTPPSHPNGAHVVELEVDPDTGSVHVDRYYVVDDLGRIINPMIVKGQQMGGVVQGIGQALIEHQVYDRASGPAHHRQLHGLRHAARRRDAERRVPAGRGAVQDQSARRQGHRRVRHHRRAAGRHQCADRCAASARRRPDRHAGDAVAGVGDDPARPQERRGGNGSLAAARRCCDTRPHAEAVQSFAPSDFTPQLSGALAVDEQSFSFALRVPNKPLERRRAFAR